MAGDWIKIELATPDKPEIDQISSALGIDHDAVLGKLVRLWIWADEQSVDGNALSVTQTMIDRVTYATGMSQALIDCGWLVGSDGDFSIPNFAEHNGKSAKSRALTNRRVSKSREVKRKCNGVSVTEPYQKALPEKRREEKSIEPPISPKGDWDGVFPKSSLSKSKTDQKKIRVLRSNEKMAFIGKWFGRKPETLWTVAEAVSLRDINPSREEVELIANYRDTDNEFHRRDVSTLLNNWNTELDRARKVVCMGKEPEKIVTTGPEGWQRSFRELIPNGPMPIQWGHIDPELKSEIIEDLEGRAS
jgi:hypothetical protein